MKKFGIVALAFFVGTAAFGDTKTFKSPDYGFSVQFPVDWTVDELPKSTNPISVTAFQAHKMGAALQVSITDLYAADQSDGSISKDLSRSDFDASHTADDYYDSQIKDVSTSFKDFNIIEREHRFMDGVKSFYVRFSASLSNGKNETTSLVFVWSCIMKKGIVYHLVFATSPETYASNLSLIENATDSFHVDAQYVPPKVVTVAQPQPNFLQRIWNFIWDGILSWVKEWIVGIIIFGIIALVAGIGSLVSFIFKRKR